ncbi:MAG: hypothetical protein R6W87_10230 [Halospina sp.]
MVVSSSLVSGLVLADITVMPKAVAHPSEARLMACAHRRVVAPAKADELKFRQTCERSLDGLVVQIGRYAHARQVRRMHKRLPKLHGYLGRVCNDVIRQQPYVDAQSATFSTIFPVARRSLRPFRAST